MQEIIMKHDLDALMEQRGLDAFVVTGGEEYSVIRDYLTNGAKIHGGYIIKRRGEAPLLITNPMEVEEGQKSGLKTITYNDFDYMSLVKQANGDSQKASVGLWGKMLDSIGVTSGRVGIYGVGEIHVYINLYEQLKQVYPQYEFVGEIGLSLFDEAMQTKDSDELVRMRRVAQGTNEVVEAAWDYIADHALTEDGTVVKADGTPLTIGDVRSFFTRELAARGLEDTGTIFAQGRDAGFPHSRGEDPQALKAGQAIVFDIFPREAGGGYHHDMTRTWSIGYATPDVQKAYDEVMEAFDIAVETYSNGGKSSNLQLAVLDYLEGKGHKTQRSHPGSMDGYVHSLGHGLGLQIHERPSLSHMRTEDILQPGNFITIEPGVYYPDAGYGVRVEDTFYITEQGELLSLTPFKKDLVIPMTKKA
jgi:Xaa-Pro aminopeptidase